jgi:hypothetical protein
VVYLNRSFIEKSFPALLVFLFPAFRVFAGPAYGPEQALQDFQKANYQSIDQHFDAALSGNDPDPGYLAFLAEKTLGRLENMSGLRQWLAQNPHSSTAWASLGMVYKLYADNFREKNQVSNPNYATMLTSYKTCLDRAIGAAPQAGYLWALEIRALLYFKPDENVTDSYFRRGLTLNRDLFLIYAAKADDMARQKDADWPKIKDFLSTAAGKSPASSRAKLLVVYYHEIFGKSKPAVYADYLQQPENWGEITGPLGDYLWSHPEDVDARAWYARLCMDAQNYAEAWKQFQFLDNNGSAYLYGGWTSKDDYVAKRQYVEDHH